MASRTVSPTQATKYYVQATNAGGTKGKVEEIEVKVHATPTATFSTSTAESCVNSNASVTIQLTGTAPWSIVYTDGAQDYTVSGINAGTHTFDIPITKTATYNIKEVKDANCQNTAVAGSDITITANTPVSITKQPVGSSFCPGSGFTLSVDVAGVVVSYQWYKDGAAISGATSEDYVVNTAVEADHGEYHVVVTGKCGLATSSKVKVRKTLDKIIVQKWNSTLVANNNDQTNGGYKFVAYKWYKDGVLVGEKPYYTVGNDPHNLLDPNAIYHAEVTTTQGEVFVTCPFTAILHEGGVKAYPNPVAAGSIVYVDADIDEELLKGATIDVYSMSGSRVGTYKVNNKITELNLPVVQGNYVVKFKSDGVEQSFVIIVK